MILIVILIVIERKGMGEKGVLEWWKDGEKLTTEEKGAVGAN